MLLYFTISPQEPGCIIFTSVLCLLDCDAEQFVLDKLVLGQGKKTNSLTNLCANSWTYEYACADINQTQQSPPLALCISVKDKTD